MTLFNVSAAWGLFIVSAGSGFFTAEAAVLHTGGYNFAVASVADGHSRGFLILCYIRAVFILPPPLAATGRCL